MNRWQHILLNIAIFQIGWAVCVIAGNSSALIYTSVAVLLHFYFFIKNSKEIYLILGFTLVGIFWDSLLMRIGALSFSESSSLIPVWLICLWALFACTLNHSLAWLSNKLLISAVVGALAAPLSYLAGIKLGAASVVLPLTTSMLFIGLGWMFILPVAVYTTRWCRHE